MEGWFQPVPDELTSDFMYATLNTKDNLQCLNAFFFTLSYRTNILLGFGISILGIFTPCIQLTLAYVYFRKSHIWSSILNASLDDKTMIKFQRAKDVVTVRLYY